MEISATRSYFANGIPSTVHKAITLLATLAVVFSRVADIVRADSLCAELISPLGYACNNYTVETADGFLLGLYNIPYGRAGPRAKTPGSPVLLVHGYQGGGDNFVLNSAEESLGTVLADAGFDVWIGNNRNIRWSHGSSIYSSDEEGFWDWTWDELGAYDVPAMIDFVYEKRGGTKVFYVGHSQGTMTLLAALTNSEASIETKASIASQLRAVVLMAPLAYNANVQAPFNKLLLDSYGDVIFPAVGIRVLDLNSAVRRLITNLTINICPTEPIHTLCNEITAGFIGTNNFINESRSSFYLKFFPGLTSSKNQNHYGQTHRSGLFQKYKTAIFDMAPLYNLSAFPTSLPLQIFTGGVDQLSDHTDSERAISELPSNMSKECLTIKDYGHVDFVIGYRAYLDVYPHLISFFGRH